MSVVGTKRRSRFEDAAESQEPEQKKIAIDVSAAAARAAEISRELSSKIAMVSNLLSSTNAGILGKGASGNSESIADRKPAYRALRLDSQGREIDEYGNVVKTGVVKTLAANMAVEKANKKKENPYLAHRTVSNTIGSAVPLTSGGATPATLSTSDQAAGAEASDVIIDERLPQLRRDLRGKKALHFVEAGKFIEEAEKIKAKEERKIIAGYASGRKTIQHQHAEHQNTSENDGGMQVGADAEQASSSSSKAGLATMDVVVAAYPDSTVPALEWWDEAFLPKERREARKISKAALLNSAEDIAQLAVHHARTYKLVQHPVPVRPLGVGALGERPAIVLPMYLTKQERKKMRRTSRQERELEKRDKMMMGLIPAPEPKLKLSNFMKVLGDQAVADPSLVEARVLQQMQKRVLNHEMRNQAAKLTPQERKDKKLRKRQEDTSRSVSVAVFRVKNFASLKHRFKVDVNAQQLFLSGIVLLCEGSSSNSLVVVEGGPKGVRKFIKLMTERINWTEPWIPSVHPQKQQSLMGSSAGEEGEEGGDNSAFYGGAGGSGAEGGDEGEGSSSDSDSDTGSDGEGEGKGTAATGAPQQPQLQSQYQAQEPQVQSMEGNRCDLLWQGALPKRCFTGFKFQESQSEAAARKLMKAKGVGHYWDMVESADSILASSAAPSLF